MPSLPGWHILSGGQWKDGGICQLCVAECSQILTLDEEVENGQMKNALLRKYGGLLGLVEKTLWVTNSSHLHDAQVERSDWQMDAVGGSYWMAAQPA